ncbi:hypothetical protein ABID26_005965 [Mesorhizobium shonense]|uniref:Uncharacterized protein n=1 Tax=Mesorhizobium shonense TaxID=1209948 RepID=A0ABV2I0Y4_9HYPH
MRQRLDLAEAMQCGREALGHGSVRQGVMDEFEVVLGQIPYVGGPTGRMRDFSMRLMGFMGCLRTSCRCP